MPSHAEKYAAAKRRNAERATPLHAFATTLPFQLDEFQVRACRALQNGSSVLVAAPTGSGKTVVGEFAVALAVAAGSRAFYTTPIKALSNQKYLELLATYGPDAVGLLTGDNAINPDAAIVVMTTEVLRNMLYEQSSALAGLSHVVMDEVHYLADRSRGAVWEEVLIQLPGHVAVAALSATVSNAEEFGQWLGTVRGHTEIVVEEHRPVPLYQHVAVGSRLLDLYVNTGGDRGATSENFAPSSVPTGRQHPGVNPELERIAQDARTSARIRASSRKRGGYRRSSGHGPRIPRRWEVIERLERAGLLPAITFIFSRAGCDAAAESVAAAGLRLTSPAEAEEIRIITETRCAHLPTADLALLGFDSWVDMLTRGIAAHHAGMLPAFKEVVEELFQKGLIRAVFATETLALGINMPARSVVLEKLTKFNGDTHADLTAGEYTQLTGRAGRRGIDVEGHAVVVWHDGFEPSVLAGLAATRTYPLRSSFHPSYNMAVNLVANMGVQQAREALSRSFAQFQADQSVVGAAAKLSRQEEAAAGYLAAMTCHLGDFAEYAALRDQLTTREKELSKRSSARAREDVRTGMGALRRGDVIVIPMGRRTSAAAVIDVGEDAESDPKLIVVTLDGRVKRVSVQDLPAPPAPVTTMKLPKGGSARSATWRRDVALKLRERISGLALERPRSTRNRTGADDQTLEDLRAALRRHPCHGCQEREEHARWAQRYTRLQREITQAQRRLSGRTNTLARQFDRVCEVLSDLGYLQGSGDNLSVTPVGHSLARIYNDNDLLVTQALRTGLWDGLTGPELAAVASALVFQGRTDEPRTPEIPTRNVARALRDQARLLAELKDLEHTYKVAYLGDVDSGFAQAAYSWVLGRALPQVLAEADMAPGDFVRWCKQLADFLDQVAVAAGVTDSRAVATLARESAAAIRRGVVSYGSLV